MKKGITLIELLAVIVILAIVLLITIVSVDSTLLNSKKNLYSIQQKNIEEAAKTYYLKEGMLFDDECVSVSKLLSKGYLEGEKVINAETKEEMTGYVKITYNNNQYNYKYQEDTCEIYEAIVNPAVGSTPSNDANGNIVVGSAFKIKVNNTAKPMTFFVLSNSEDGKYVNLIAEQNIAPNGNFTSEPQPGDEWYSELVDNRYSLQTALTYLNNATSNWTNIPILEKFNYFDEVNQINSSYGYQSIKTEFDESTRKYKVIITLNASLSENPVIYENMRARLPKYSEVMATEVGCTLEQKTCPLWMVNYLSSNTNYSSNEEKINSTGTNYGYWLLTSHQNPIGAKVVYYDGSIYYANTNSANYGVRPVITIPKSTLLNEIK